MKNALILVGAVGCVCVCVGGGGMRGQVNMFEK